MARFFLLVIRPAQVVLTGWWSGMRNGRECGGREYSGTARCGVRATQHCPMSILQARGVDTSPGLVFRESTFCPRFDPTTRGATQVRTQIVFLLCSLSSATLYPQTLDVGSLLRPFSSTTLYIYIPGLWILDPCFPGFRAVLCTPGL